MPYAQGSRVRLVGLKARPELNTRLAEVVGPPNDAGRIPVKLLGEAGEPVGLLLQPANLSQVDAIHEPSSPPAQPPTATPAPVESPIISKSSLKPQSAPELLPLPHSPMWMPPSFYSELLMSPKSGDSAPEGDSVLDTALLDHAARRIVGGSEGAWRRKQLLIS